MADASEKTAETVPDELIGSPAYRDDGSCKTVGQIIRRIVHWGPLTALFIIFYTSAVAIDCILRWWPPVSASGGIHLFIFVMWVYLTLYNYINAVVIGPGWLPRGWAPSDREARAYLQYCYACRGYKAPRSHHCSACRRCVLKMDHHCPWINVCCGHKNHGYFLLFLYFAVCGCFHAFVVFVICMFKFFVETMPLQMRQMARAAQREQRARAREMGLDLGYPYDDEDDWQPESDTLVFGMWQLLGILFAVGLALGVILAVGGLFVVQMRSVLRNRTGIEQYICEKAVDRERAEAKRRAQRAVTPQQASESANGNGSELRRRKPNGDRAADESASAEDQFVFPYDIDWRTNVHLALASALYPLTKPNYTYGVWWPLRAGCDQFTMTREQMKQKREKFSHAFIVRATEPFHGSYSRSLASEGLRSLFGLPCCAGSLLSVQRGDVLLVTNWRKQWLFGRRLRIQELASPTEHDTRSQAEIVRAALAEREDLVATRERGWFAKRCVVQLV